MKLFILLLAFVIFPAHAKIPRSAAAVAEFKRTHPCPATNKIQKSCPNFVVDHKIPLCGGGADNPSNMHWQTKAESLKKDKREVAYCACLKKHGHSGCLFTP
jgi:hypothetical protein